MSINKAVTELKLVRQQTAKELERIDTALTALGGKKPPQRVLSKEARERIAQAQRLRWAKVRKAAKKGAA